MSQVGDPRIGTELGGYRIESLIGRGGMSVVYLAEDLSLRRKVALKLLAPELAGDERFRERFVRESQLAASLDHPNIVPIFEAREREGVLFIAMRYVEGTDLKRLINAEGSLTPARTIGILSQVAGALDAAHARGLVHRDVKPGNVLIAAGSGQEHVYLSDFGLTKRASSESGITGTGQFLGTLDYAAPEQFEGAPLDARADLYSLGCVLYECLVGRPPFERETDAALVFAHIQAPPPRVTDSRPELPEAIDAVVARGMAKQPEDRYETAAAQIGAAGAALAVTASEGTLPAPPPSGRFSRARSALIGGIAAVAVAAIVAGLILNRGSAGTSRVPSPSTSASGPSAPPLIADHLVRIDPATRQPVTSIPVGSSPGGVAVGEGSVWVTNTDDDTVSRLDPVTNKVVATIDVDKGPIGIADAAGAIWVANRLSGTVSRIDPANNQVSATIETGDASTGIAADVGGVWVTTERPDVGAFPGGVSRIDPASNQVSTTTDVRSFCPAVVAAGDGMVWIATNTGQIARLDPSTLAVGDSLTLESPMSGIAIGDGSVWSGSDGRSATLTRVDPLTGKVQQQIPIGSTIDPSGPGCAPIGIAVGGGFVWATNADDGSVSVVATISNDVIDVAKVGGKPTAIAFGLGGVWVAVDEP